jgi:uncharacterized membrane protein
LFIAYQVYRIALDATAGLVALTVFDLVIVALTWREYGQQRRRLASVDADPVATTTTGTRP